MSYLSFSMGYYYFIMPGAVPYSNFASIFGGGGYLSGISKNDKSYVSMRGTPKGFSGFI
jgi:hypothetical protein